MSTKNYSYFLREEHNRISECLNLEFYSYLDCLSDNEYRDNDEKKFIKKFVKAIIDKFGRSQEEIGDAFDKGDHSLISIKTERLNYFLKNFSKGRVDPPIQVFYHHLTPEDQKKRPQCHLACSYGKKLSAKNDSIRIYSADILPFEQAEKSIVVVIPPIYHHLTEFREKLKEAALEHLKEKLNGEDDYIPLELEIGLFEEKVEFEEKFLPDNRYDHGRKWKEFDLQLLKKLDTIYILSSETGSGKTTFLRQLQLELIEETNFIPLFLEASVLEKGVDFGNQNEENFMEGISKYFKGYLQSENVLGFIKEQKDKIIFLIDGLDQISGFGTQYNNFINNLFGVIKNRLILTSRPFAVIEKENDEKIKLLRLKSFNEKNMQVYFGDKYDLAKKLCRSCPEMVRIPMLAYMIRSLIGCGKNKNIQNRMQLYKRFVDYIFEKYSHGNIEMSLGKNVKMKEALEEISFMAIANNPPFLQKIPIEFAVKRIKTNIEIDDLFKYGLVSLIVNQSKGSNKFLYFSHQSFQEYLAAKYISQNANIIQQVLTEKWNPKWKEVIKFLVGIQGDWVIREIYSPDTNDNSIHSNLFLAAECCRELDKVSSLEVYYFQELKKLLYSSVFKHDALFAVLHLKLDECIIDDIFDYLLSPICNLDEMDAGISDFVNNCISSRHIDILYDKINHKNNEKSINLASYVSISFTHEQISRLIEVEILNKDIEITSIFRYDISKNITKEHIDKILLFLNNDDFDIRLASVRLLSAIIVQHSKSISIYSIYSIITDDQISQLIGHLIKPTWNSYSIISLLIHLSSARVLKDKHIELILKSFRYYTHKEQIFEVMCFFSKQISKQNIDLLNLMLNNPDIEVVKSSLYALAVIIQNTPKKLKDKAIAFLKNDNSELKIGALVAIQHLNETLPQEDFDIIIDILKNSNDKVFSEALKTITIILNSLSESQLNLAINSIINRRLFHEYTVNFFAGETTVLTDHIPGNININQSYIDIIMSYFRSPNIDIKRNSIVMLIKIINKLRKEHINEIVAFILLKKAEATTKEFALLALESCDKIYEYQLSVLIESFLYQEEAVKFAILKLLKKHISIIRKKNIDLLVELLLKTGDRYNKEICEILITCNKFLSLEVLKKLKLYHCNCDSCVIGRSAMLKDVKGYDNGADDLRQQDIDCIIELLGSSCCLVYRVASYKLSQFTIPLDRQHLNEIIEISFARLRDVIGGPILSFDYLSDENIQVIGEVIIDRLLCEKNFRFFPFANTLNRLIDQMLPRHFKKMTDIIHGVSTKPNCSYAQFSEFSEVALFYKLVKNGYGMGKCLDI